MMKLTPLQLYIMAHLKRANIDFAKSIGKNIKFPVEDINKELKRMESSGLIERVHGSAVKRTDAKFKLAQEVRKHHTYYSLSEKGEKLVRDVRKNTSKHFQKMVGDAKALDVLLFIKRAEYEHAEQIGKSISLTRERTRNILHELVQAGLVSEEKPKLLKRKHRKGKPKKETRTQHKYYRITRVGEMIFRYLF
ncbi:MAG: DUF2250 domain-containing protein [Archaeoglobaceae archaeon]